MSHVDISFFFKYLLINLNFIMASGLLKVLTSWKLFYVQSRVILLLIWLNWYNIIFRCSFVCKHLCGKVHFSLHLSLFFSSTVVLGMQTYGWTNYYFDHLPFILLLPYLVVNIEPAKIMKRGAIIMEDQTTANRFRNWLACFCLQPLALFETSE